MISDISTEPTPVQPQSRHGVRIWFQQLDEDIDLAARHGVPVLITASDEDATTIVQAIACSNPQAADLLTWDGQTEEDLIAAVNRQNGAAGHTTILWLKGIHRLSPTQQAALLNVLGNGATASRELRIIASSPVDLYESVAIGDFDARLFYRLNTVHIVVPSSVEGEVTRRRRLS